MKIEGRHYFTQVGVGIDSLMIRDTADRAEEAVRPPGLHGDRGDPADRVPAPAVHDHRRRPDDRVKASQVLVANTGMMGTTPSDGGPISAPMTAGSTSASSGPGRSWIISACSGTSSGAATSRAPTSAMRSPTRSIVIEAKHPLPVQADGEILGDTPVRIEVVPLALKVVVPVAADPGGLSGPVPAPGPRPRPDLRAQGRWSAARRTGSTGRIGPSRRSWHRRRPGRAGGRGRGRAGGYGSSREAGGSTRHRPRNPADGRPGHEGVNIPRGSGRAIGRRWPPTRKSSSTRWTGLSEQGVPLGEILAGAGLGLIFGGEEFHHGDQRPLGSMEDFQVDLANFLQEQTGIEVGSRLQSDRAASGRREAGRPLDEEIRPDTPGRSKGYSTRWIRSSIRTS